MLTSGQNIIAGLAVLALLLGLYSLWQIVSLNRLRKSFFAGKNGVDLEDVIFHLRDQLQDGQRQQLALELSQNELKETLGFAVQKVGLVRFNPFQGGGGNFSFSLALLDNHNSGVVITSMYGREQNRIYTKKVQSGASDSQLTDEETEAVQIANLKHTNTKVKQKR